MMLSIVLFITQIVTLYFLSRITIDELFKFFRKFIHNERMVFSIITLIFLPGTLFHEISHMFAAMILFLKVYSVTVIPKLEQDHIRLGSVIYEKTDVVRSVFVGIAPFFGAIIFFWSISFFNIFPSQNLLTNILMMYLIFIVSSTMFSSKKDLQDLIFVIPLLLLIIIIVYIFNLGAIINSPMVIVLINNFIQKTNIYLIIPLIVHLVLIVFIKNSKYIIK